MPTKPKQQKVKSWSFSRYDDYEQCPFRFKLKHLEKRAAPSGPALERGADIHNKAHTFVTGKLKKLPSELKLFAKEFAALRKIGGENEEKYAMTNKWDMVDFFDWKNAWVRVVMDHSHVLPKKRSHGVIIDYKTGKSIKPIYEEQLELYAILMFVKDKVQHVEAALWFTDLGEIKKNSYDVSQLPKLIKAWESRVRPMMNDTRFIPRPGDYCRWCPFSAHKGGPCKY